MIFLKSQRNAEIRKGRLCKFLNLIFMKKALFICLLSLITINLAFSQVEAGVYYRIIAKHSGKALDVSGGVEGRANGIPVVQYDAVGGANQFFKFVSVGDGYYRIIAKHSGKALDVSEGVDGVRNGIPIVQYDPVGGANQFFKLVSVGDGYYRIIAKHSGKALDVSEGVDGVRNGVPIVQYDPVGGANQFFKFVRVN